MHTRNPKILLVEDEPDVCMSIQAYLGRRGFWVWTISSGKEALSMIEAFPPEIVLLDLVLNDWHGKEVLKNLRQTNQKIKVIIITGAYLTQSEIKDIHTLGVSGYFQKPLLLEELEKSIRKILDNELLEDLHTNKSSPSDSSEKDQEPSADLKEIQHELSNITGIIRNSCEQFLLDRQDGFHKDMTDKEVLNLAVEIMERIMKNVERLQGVLKKISS